MNGGLSVYPHKENIWRQTFYHQPRQNQWNFPRWATKQNNIQNFEIILNTSRQRIRWLVCPKAITPSVWSYFQPCTNSQTNTEWAAKAAEIVHSDNHTFILTKFKECLLHRFPVLLCFSFNQTKMTRTVCRNLLIMQINVLILQVQFAVKLTPTINQPSSQQLLTCRIFTTSLFIIIVFAWGSCS